MTGLRVHSFQDSDTEALARQIVDCVFQVHTAMGPGLLEKIYEECVVCEFQDRGIAYEQQKPVLLNYKHHKINMEYKFDLLVANRIVVELKSAEKTIDLFKAQTLSYMKLLNVRLGLLINFNTPLIKDGITRLVL